MNKLKWLADKWIVIVDPLVCVVENEVWQFFSDLYVLPNGGFVASSRSLH